MSDTRNVWAHDDDHAADKFACDVCERVYIDEVDAVIELHEIVNAMYALFGENEEVRELAEKADQIATYGASTRSHHDKAFSIAPLHAEIGRLRRWVTDLQSGLYVNCVYCGHRYGPNDRVPVAMADALKAHVEVCPWHPMSALKERIDQLTEQKDGAYLERNQCVALLASMAICLGFAAGRTRTAIEGWDPEWHGCIYILLPTGQVSWHYHDSHAELFAHLPEIKVDFDGHTTAEKYRRVDEMARVLVTFP